MPHTASIAGLPLTTEAIIAGRVLKAAVPVGHAPAPRGADMEFTATRVHGESSHRSDRCAVAGAGALADADPRMMAGVCPAPRRGCDVDRCGLLAYKYVRPRGGCGSIGTRAGRFERSMASARSWAWTRRGVLTLATGFAGCGLMVPARADDDVSGLVKQLIGRSATESDRVHLTMPRVFPNGYTVPLTLEIDSAMTLTDYVKRARVLAPRNPLVEVATFHFTPEHSQARVATRIRLAAPQFVLAIAEFNDDRLLMAKAWVEVATNGCS